MYRKINFPLPVTIPSVAPVLLLLSSEPAFAYIGPGAGLSAVGAALALVGAVVLAIVGFLWYPAKRLVRRLRGAPGTGAPHAREADTGSRTPGQPPK